VLPSPRRQRWHALLDEQSRQFKLYGLANAMAITGIESMQYQLLYAEFNVWFHIHPAISAALSGFSIG
jgi:hypothetical protein